MANMKTEITIKFTFSNFRTLLRILNALRLEFAAGISVKAITFAAAGGANAETVSIGSDEDLKSVVDTLAEHLK